MIRCTRRPLVGLALAFMMGIAVGSAFGGHLIPLFAGTAACLLSAWSLSRSSRPVFVTFANSMILAGLFGIGWIHVTLDQNARSASSLTGAARESQLIGIVAEDPITSSGASGRVKWTFPLNLERARDSDALPWHPQSGTVRIRVSAPANCRRPAYGERWSFCGQLDMTVYKQGRRTGQPSGYVLFAAARQARFLSAGHGNPIIHSCLAARAWASSLLSRGIDDFPEQVTILQSLLLGYYSQIPRDLYQAFAATGTLHVYAISGSHVAVFCGVLIIALAACGIPRTRWVLLLAPLLLGYTILTGLQVSAVRACIMAILFWLGPLIGRKADIHTALAASAILILAVDPQDLTQIGFVLSFVAVLGLVLFYSVFAEPLRRPLAPDPLQLQPDPRWKQYGRRTWAFLADLLAMSLAAWLVSAPLTAWYFETFSPIGLLGNLVAVPLASLVIVTGFLSLTLGACMGSLADVFNHANLVLIQLLTTTIRWFASVPYGYLKVGAPSAWFLPLFYSTLALWRFRIWINQQDKASEERPPISTP